MFKKSLVLVILLCTVGNINSADDTISQWTYQYMKKINGYISEENWVEAKRELEKSYSNLPFNTQNILNAEANVNNLTEGLAKSKALLKKLF